MKHWQATFLGLKQLPCELSGFEIEAFFTFSERTSVAMATAILVGESGRSGSDSYQVTAIGGTSDHQRPF